MAIKVAASMLKPMKMVSKSPLLTRGAEDLETRSRMRKLSLSCM